MADDKKEQKQPETALQKKENGFKMQLYKAKKSFIGYLGMKDEEEAERILRREVGFASQVLMKNDYLSKMNSDSIRNSLVNVALTGLTLNPALKYAYLVPRGGECVLDISYMGMIKLLTEQGSIKNIDAGVIYENDDYDFRRGSDPYFKIKPKLANRGEKIGTYAVAYFRDGGSQFEIMAKEDVEKVKSMSESLKNEKAAKHSPWTNWEDEMWKKTVLKRLFKLLPKTKMSDNLIAALNNEHTNDVSDLPKNVKDSQFKDMFTEDVGFEDVKEEPKKGEDGKQTTIPIDEGKK